MFCKDDVLDAMAVVGFLIGIANYQENIDQSQLQETAQTIIKEIHSHLKEQDSKIDEIYKYVLELKGKEGI